MKVSIDPAAIVDVQVPRVLEWLAAQDQTIAIETTETERMETAKGPTPPEARATPEERQRHHPTAARADLRRTWREHHPLLPAPSGRNGDQGRGLDGPDQPGRGRAEDGAQVLRPEPRPPAGRQQRAAGRRQAGVLSSASPVRFTPGRGFRPRYRRPKTARHSPGTRPG